MQSGQDGEGRHRRRRRARSHRTRPPSPAALAAVLPGQTRPALLAGLIVQHSVMLVAGAQYASLSTVTPAGLTVLSQTADIAGAADTAQDRIGEGPCLECHALPATGDVVGWWRCHDLATDGRWPRWGPVTAAGGTRSLLAAAIPGARQNLTLSLYSRRRNAFRDQKEVDRLLDYVALAGGTLSATGVDTAHGDARDTAVAQGILMARYALTADQALGALARIAEDSNTDLADLARDVQREDGLPVSAAVHLLFARLRH